MSCDPILWLKRAYVEKKCMFGLQDFDTAMTIATTLESHAVAVYQQMPKVTMKGRRLSFYEKLPKSFTTKEYLVVAKELGICDKTASNYIRFFNTKLLNHEFNCFTKLN